jgi:hypothetical protein
MALLSGGVSIRTTSNTSSKQQQQQQKVTTSTYNLSPESIHHHKSMRSHGRRLASWRRRTEKHTNRVSR